MVREGLVKVNGEQAILGATVFPNDKVEVRGKAIGAAPEKVYIILNKPKGFVCSNRHFEGEQNIFDLLVDRKGGETKLKQRLFVVGRLDKNSRGLVLLTNDGDLALKMEHPRFGQEKEYVATIKNDKLRITNKTASQLMSGVDIGEGDGVVKAKSAEYVGEGKFKIILTEGKKRQIRRMFKKLGFEVSDLVRTHMGCPDCGIDLDNLAKGCWRCLKTEEVMKLKVKS